MGHPLFYVWSKQTVFAYMEQADHVGVKQNSIPACHRHVYHVVHALRCPALAGRTDALIQEL